MKIPNFSKRFQKALYDPIAVLAVELSKEGYTELDVTESKRNTMSMPYILRLQNYMKDIERAGKPIDTRLF